MALERLQLLTQKNFDRAVSQKPTSDLALPTDMSWNKKKRDLKTVVDSHVLSEGQWKKTDWTSSKASVFKSL